MSRATTPCCAGAPSSACRRPRPRRASPAWRPWSPSAPRPASGPAWSPTGRRCAAGCGAACGWWPAATRTSPAATCALWRGRSARPASCRCPVASAWTTAATTGGVRPAGGAAPTCPASPVRCPPWRWTATPGAATVPSSPTRRCRRPCASATCCGRRASSSRAQSPARPRRWRPVSWPSRCPHRCRLSCGARSRLPTTSPASCCSRRSGGWSRAGAARSPASLPPARSSAVSA